MENKTRTRLYLLLDLKLEMLGDNTIHFRSKDFWTICMCHYIFSLVQLEYHFCKEVTINQAIREIYCQSRMLPSRKIRREKKGFLHVGKWNTNNNMRLLRTHIL